MQHKKTRMTCHSYDRLKTRSKIKNTAAAERRITLAYERGKRFGDYRSKYEREFLRQKSGDGIEAVAFDGFCYIFNTKRRACITLYRLPHQFGKKYREYRDVAFTTNNDTYGYDDCLQAVWSGDRPAA